MPIYSPALSHYVAVQSPLHIDPGGPVENHNLLNLGDAAASALRASYSKPGSSVSINPQPLPPKGLLQPYLNPGVLVGLNPQPLPPEPPPTEVFNLWEHSAVLSARDGSVLPPFFHGPTPDPGPDPAWMAGAWLR